MGFILRMRDQVRCTVLIKLWLNRYIGVNLAVFLLTSFNVPLPRSLIIALAVIM